MTYFGYPLDYSKDEFVNFHAKQGFVLFVLELIFTIILVIPMFNVILVLTWIILSILGIRAVLNNKKWEIPYIVTSHGRDTYRCFEDSIESVGIKPFPKSVLRKYIKAVTNANAVVGVSNVFSKQIRKIAPNANVMTIQNSYKKDIFYRLDKVKCKKDLNLDLGKIQLLSVGNFVPSKRHIDMIEALSLIDCRKVHLTIIGSGNLKQLYLDRINEFGLQERVTIIDPIKQDELVLWYNATDLFLFPSQKESFGISLVEAMACGCPAIAAKAYGPLEIVEDGENGFLVDILNRNDEIFSDRQEEKFQQVYYSTVYFCEVR
jgi:glycosyltransferase involved in cell wall biosynthesis